MGTRRSLRKRRVWMRRETRGWKPIFLSTFPKNMRWCRKLWISPASAVDSQCMSLRTTFIASSRALVSPLVVSWFPTNAWEELPPRECGQSLRGSEQEGHLQTLSPFYQNHVAFACSHIACLHTIFLKISIGFCV